MARKPATPTSKTIDSLSSMVNEYFVLKQEVDDNQNTPMMRHMKNEKMGRLERKIRPLVGLPALF